MSHRRRDVPGGLGLSLGLRAGGPILGGGGQAQLLSWTPILSEPVPAGWTFSRTSVAWYRGDIGIWAQVGTGVIRDGHNALRLGGGKGYLAEEQATNLALFNRDFTNAVWVATNITPAKDEAGIDGVANSASSLTATANNGTILQSFTRGASDHTFTIFVARRVGTGTVEITIDGSTWIDITSSLDTFIDNPFVVHDNLANPSIGFRLGTSGDKIAADMSGLEATSIGTSPIETLGSPITRQEDLLTTDQNFPVGGWTAFCDATGPEAVRSISAGIGGLESGGISMYARTSGIISSFINGTNFSIGVGGEWFETRLKTAFSNPTTIGGTALLAVTGETTASGITNADVTETICIGHRFNQDQFLGTIHDVFVRAGPTDQTDLEDLVNAPP